MTGFGGASEQVDGVMYTVELVSLNNRYFKVVARLSEDLSGLESSLETLLRKRLVRGTVTVTVKTRLTGESGLYEVDEVALGAYLEKIKALNTRLSDSRVVIDLTQLLSLPSVLQPAQESLEALEKARPVVERLTSQACDNLVLMRQEEGRVVAEDLVKQLSSMRRHLDDILQRAPAVVEEYHQRLRTRIDELLARAELKVQEKDLIQEVAIFAERADISEEASRMGGHLNHFRQVVESANGEPVGRKLDFLAQEMLREANTIASKSNDGQISRSIVDVKGAIDRLKEQVQNVE